MSCPFYLRARPPLSRLPSASKPKLMNTGKQDLIKEKSVNYKGYLIDLDGTIYKGERTDLPVSTLFKSYRSAIPHLSLQPITPLGRLRSGSDYAGSILRLTHLAEIYSLWLCRMTLDGRKIQHGLKSAIIVRTSSLCEGGKSGSWRPLP